MKQILSFFRWSGLVVLAVLLASCGNQRSAKRVATAFLQSYYVDNDFETAMALSTEATQEPLAFRAQLFLLNPHSGAESIEGFKFKKIDVKKTKAVCFYEVIGAERRLNLSKVNGQWLVDMPERTTMDPAFSLSPQAGGTGGFASAESEPIRLKDIPEASGQSTNRKSNN